ncbi:MAG: HD domain-containing protein [Thermodesulfovibrionales bacterium]
MRAEELAGFRKWFARYAGSFRSPDVEYRKSIALKVRHTFKVCENMRLITRGEGVDGGDALVAEAIALFHDVGRFPQYDRYRTFMDSRSVDHGALGAEVLAGEGVLGGLAPAERDLIVAAVRRHNAFSLAGPGDERELFFLKLVRDADKLDIWRVFVEIYEGRDVARAAVLGLPDNGRYSPEVLARLKAGAQASIAGMRTLDDFRLVQLSWAYDLNFRTSFRLLLERDYIARILARLPREREIDEAAAALRAYAEGKAAG